MDNCLPDSENPVCSHQEEPGTRQAFCVASGLQKPYGKQSHAIPMLPGRRPNPMKCFNLCPGPGSSGLEGTDVAEHLLRSTPPFV
jgi:hypothetical protein